MTTIALYVGRLVSYERLRKACCLVLTVIGLLASFAAIIAIWVYFTAIVLWFFFLSAVAVVLIIIAWAAVEYLWSRPRGDLANRWIPPERPAEAANDPSSGPPERKVAEAGTESLPRVA